MRFRQIGLAAAALVLATGLSSAWAFVVSDAAVTARNAITALLKNNVLDTLTAQSERLERMAARLSALTTPGKFAVEDAPSWQAYESGAFLQTLSDGESAPASFDTIARLREAADGLEELPGDARELLVRQLASLDVVDSTIVLTAEQIGRLRRRGADEQRVIDQLERDVLDASTTQSTTAVLDKISAATLIEVRQKQARLRYLSSLLEHQLVDSTRARDAEVAVLNMQRGRLRAMSHAEEGGWLRGAAADLRNWRQP